MSHDGHPRPFPFDEAENLAVFVCQRVANGAPILEVTHDEEGDWQFLCGADHRDPAPDDGGIVRCLGCVLALDPALASLATLRERERAERPNAAAPWRITDEHEELLERAIATVGWGITAVPEGDSDDEPPFAYTSGLSRLGVPELIVFGLPPSTAMHLLNAVAARVRDGDAPIGPPLVGCLAGDVPVRLRELRSDEPAAAHLTYARALARGASVRILQVLWPDRDGDFPDEEGAMPSFRRLQSL